jgi:hypothetical protein
VTKFSLGITTLAAVGTNLYEYGLGEHKDKGVGSQEFWVSTGVDFGLSILTGIVAACGLTAVMAALGVAVVSGPVWVGAAVAGVILSIGSDLIGLPPTLKDGTNRLVDAAEAESIRLENVPEVRQGPRGGPVPNPN